jgi:hypothetical protein
MPDITRFDVTVAAESYSAVAGIISGFAFVVLVWLVERITRTDHDAAADLLTGRALVIVAITFVANVLVAFMWALISGETRLDSTRPGILSFLAGLNFALVVPLTLEAMVFVVTTTGIRQVLTLFRRIFLTGVIVSLAFQWTSTLGLVETQERTAAALQAHPVFFTLLPALTLGLALAAFVLSRRATGQRFSLDSEASFSRFASVWLAGILVSGVGFGYVSASRVELFLPLWVVGLANVLWAVLIGWGMAFLPADV